MLGLSSSRSIVSYDPIGMFFHDVAEVVKKILLNACTSTLEFLSPMLSLGQSDNLMDGPCRSESAHVF